MSDHVPTIDDEEIPQPSASPQEHLSPDPHRAALFSTDPVFDYHKKLNNVPPVKEDSPEELLSGKLESLPEPELEIRIEDETVRVKEETTTEPGFEHTPFVQWLVQKPAVKIQFTDLASPSPEKTRIDPKPKAGRTGKKGKHAKKKSKPGQKGSKGASKSRISLKHDIFSETLADLLASQGHTKKAIQMYQRLSLIYPEKSRLFAAKIEELKKIE